jgi:hypothetical protein
MKKLALLTALGSLAFSVACGGGSNGGGFGSPGGTGSFSAASLSGQYAYEVAGFSGPSAVSEGSPFREAGVFTADGNQHITSDTDNFAIGSSVISDTATGSYTVNGDGTVNLILNFAGGGSSTFAMTLVSPSKFYIVEDDAGSTSYGVGEKQDTTAIASVPSGTFVFSMHTIGGLLGATSRVGAFTASTGSVSGNTDRNIGGTASSSAITGLLNSPNTSTGIGSGTFTDASNVTSTFLYYVVDANHLFLFSTDAGILGIGQAEMQSGAPFSMASLSGSYAFGSRGETDSNFFFAFNSVGRFSADGAGTISAGDLDAVQDGTSTTNAGFTGTYTMASNGRAVVTLGLPSGTTQEIFWMVNPSRAFFVSDSNTRVEDGTVDLQQTGTFSSASLNGFYAFVMDGFDGGGTKDRTGTFNWDGNSKLTVFEVANSSGLTSSSSVSGTYSVASNGRALGSVNTLSNNLVFYLISNNDAYVLQNDSGIEIEGTMSKQP